MGNQYLGILGAVKNCHLGRVGFATGICRNMHYHNLCAVCVFLATTLPPTLALARRLNNYRKMIKLPSIKLPSADYVMVLGGRSNFIGLIDSHATA